MVLSIILWSTIIMSVVVATLWRVAETLTEVNMNKQVEKEAAEIKEEYSSTREHKAEDSLCWPLSYYHFA